MWERKMPDDIETVLRAIERQASEISELNGVSCNSMIEISEAKGNINIFISFNKDAENGNINAKDQSQEEYLKLFKENLKKRRKLRKTDELPFPELPSNSEEQYARKQLKNRQPEDLIERISSFAKASGKDREKCIEIAITEFLEKYEI